MKHSVWKHAKTTFGQSHAWTLIGLTAVSIAVHGIVLGLPLPNEAEQAEALVPSSSPTKPRSIMDVAILPDRSLNTPSKPKQTAEIKVSPQSVKPSRTVARSVPFESPDPIPEAADPASLSAPPIVASEPNLASSDEPASEPISSSEPPPDPVAELPPEPGSHELSAPEPLPLPPLAEQLQDPTAYQYDGRKSLDQIAAATESMNWAVAGQPLPSKIAPLELPYQLADHCLEYSPVLGLLMVVVDAEGNFLRGPEVISSTGYRVLDEQAVEQVKNRHYILPDRDAPKAYSVEVKVLYPESCL